MCSKQVARIAHPLRVFRAKPCLHKRARARKGGSRKGKGVCDAARLSESPASDDRTRRGVCRGRGRSGRRAVRQPRLQGRFVANVAFILGACSKKYASIV